MSRSTAAAAGQCHVIAGSAFRMRPMLKSKLKLYTFGECEIENAEDARENCIKDVGRAGNMISGTVRLRLANASLNSVSAPLSLKDFSAAAASRGSWPKITSFPFCSAFSKLGSYRNPFTIHKSLYLCTCFGAGTLKRAGERKHSRHDFEFNGDNGSIDM